VHAFHIHIHRVAVQAGLQGVAVLQSGIRRMRLGGNMPRGRQVQMQIAQATRYMHRVAQGRRKIKIARFVMGGVGVGNIGRQNFLALLAQAQRLLVKIELVGNAIGHKMRKYVQDRRHITGRIATIKPRKSRDLARNSCPACAGTPDYNAGMVARIFFIGLCVALGASASVAAKPPQTPIQALVQHVTQQLQAQARQQGSKLQVHVEPLHTQHVLPCTAFAALGRVKLRARVSVPVRCLAPQGWHVYVQANLALSGQYYLAARAIAPGDRIAANDVRRVKGDLLRLPPDVVTEPDALIGRFATQRIRSGSIMKTSVLRDPGAIRRGQRVRIETRGAGFVLHSEGQALQDANPGSPIQVRAASGLRVRGFVRDASTVHIPL